MGLNAQGEQDRIPWRMPGCFHNPPYKQVETMDNCLCKHACISVPNLPKPSMHGCMRHIPTGLLPLICALQFAISQYTFEQLMQTTATLLIAMAINF